MSSHLSGLDAREETPQKKAYGFIPPLLICLCPLLPCAHVLPMSENVLHCVGCEWCAFVHMRPIEKRGLCALTHMFLWVGLALTSSVPSGSFRSTFGVIFSAIIPASCDW